MDRPVALVTGASGGVGGAVALQLARDGFAVVVHYRTRKEAAEQTRDRIIGERGHATVCGFDVGKWDEVEAAVSDIGRAHGPIQVLVNSAALRRDAPLAQLSPETWRDVVDTDLTGVYHCARAVVAAMEARSARGGRIINITSVVGETGNAGQTSFAAATAGVIGFTKAAARELAAAAVTVNAVSLGFIDTEAIRRLPVKDLERRIPMKRIGAPDEVAQLVSFLASEEAAYITGQVIRVNGGLLM
jgi:3-oxoacyl-[acyl-carrier protein] reductase